MVEVNCAILCSCLPTIRYFIAIIFPCLGLRSEHSRYVDRGSSRRAGGFPLRSRRSNAARAVAAALGSNKTSASRSSVAPGRSQDPAVDDLDTRWGIDYEKGGSHYHSNHISAWVRTAPEASSPTSYKAKRSSTDEGSESGLVEPKRSDRELGNHILITRETVVEEARADDSVIALPARAL